MCTDVVSRPDFRTVQFTFPTSKPLAQMDTNTLCARFLSLTYWLELIEDKLDDSVADTDSTSRHLSSSLNPPKLSV